MRIVFHDSGSKPEPWLTGLRAALPQAQVELWAPGAPAADFAVVWAPPQQLLDEQTQLRAIFNLGAGVDALMKCALPAGVPVVRLDDAGMSVQMAEFVCHAVVRHFRELAAYEACAQVSQWSFRRPRVRADFSIGVMGLGVLGQRVARALQHFEFPVHGWSRSTKTLDGVTCHSGTAGLPGFLSSCRVLVNLLPLTPDTQDILNHQTLSLLQPGGYVINVARGAHVVDADLLALLDSGHLAGATLDVFRVEPLPAEHAFWKHPKITVTPHTSARTLRAESVAQIAQKISQVQAGASPFDLPGVVNSAQGY